MGRNITYLNEDEIDIRRRYASEIQHILLTDASLRIAREEGRALFQQARNDNDLRLQFDRLAIAHYLHEAVQKSGLYGGYATCRPEKVGPKEHNIARDEDAAKNAGIRDGNKCVVTKCNKTQICHFAAFFGINRPTAIQTLLRNMMVFMGPEASADLQAKLVGDDAIVDNPSNMVTLSHKLHTYMDDAIFGMEPVGEVSRPKPEPNASSGESNDQEMNTGPATGDSRTQGHAELQTGDASMESPDRRSGTSAGSRIGDVNLVASVNSPIRKYERLMESNLKRKAEAEAEANRIQAREEEKKAEEMIQHGLVIRCHWLPKTNLRCPLDKVEDFGADPREMMEEWSAENYEFRSESGRPLNSGTIITIWADKKTDLPDVGIMKFIFHGLCFHRLNGGADPRIYRPWTHYDEDEPGHTFASDPRMEAERRILKILAEDDKAGGVYNADRKRETEKKILRALAELEISSAEASSNTPTGSRQAEEKESRDAWSPPLPHNYVIDR
ncbi:hypothetical protein CKAH01_01801 [Colletotrichum kahawae]|uniref:HNH nuclease domain-containing protein n=1 Tax=Colletotrichum kahawae TaxID=34407 RepID=A0AAE0D0D1_COLKA|nr:hypothetical protein CKAH01_01801 [Colletotrichum kahawae]